MRFVQISDAHLNQDKPHFSDNWALLAAWIADQHPDLVIHTGDVTFDGAGVEVDLSYAAQLMDELGIRWRGCPATMMSATLVMPANQSMPSGLARGSVISAQIAGSKMSQKVRSAGVLSDST
jgi:3',5'-cyclic AMP phosphodiesterase CpdA